MTTDKNDEIPRLSRKQAEQLTGHLAEIGNSSLPLVAGLRAAADECASWRLGAALRQIAASVERGRSLDEVMSEARGRLPRHVSGLVAVATESGQLGKTLSELVDHHRASRQLKQSVVSSMAYPALVLAVTLALFVCVQVFLIGHFKTLFRDFELELPPLTLALFWWSDVGIWLLLGFLNFVVFAIGALRAIGGKACWQRIYATVPFFGPMSHWSGVAEWTRLLAILIERHVALPKALRLAADGVSDRNVAQVSEQLARDVDEGRELSQLLAKSYRLPAMLSRLVQWGQRSDALAESLRTASEMYESRVHLRATILRSVLPPVVFVVVGVFLSIVISGLFLPLMNLINGLTG